MFDVVTLFIHVDSFYMINSLDMNNALCMTMPENILYLKNNRILHLPGVSLVPV